VPMWAVRTLLGSGNLWCDPCGEDDLVSFVHKTIPILWNLCILVAGKSMHSSTGLLKKHAACLH